VVADRGSRDPEDQREQATSLKSHGPGGATPHGLNRADSLAPVAPGLAIPTQDWCATGEQGNPDIGSGKAFKRGVGISRRCTSPAPRFGGRHHEGLKQKGGR